MSTTPPPLAANDREHLRLLSIFHYVVGGLGAFFACFPLIHVFIGLMMVIQPAAIGGQSGHPPAFIGVLLAGMGMMFVLLGWAVAICTVISARFLAQRRRRMFSVVMAAILCLFVPFGTVLGVFTLIVLSRDSVRRIYGEPV